jgi:uncharacterized spore protein YtfJ
MAENPPAEAPREDYNQGIAAFQETMDRFISLADVGTAYGRPVKQGDTVIIPTAEVMCGLGFGMGTGSGGTTGEGEAEDKAASGMGSGGGGGGWTLSRPVALVIATEDEVQVVPVIDRTKIVLAALTTVGFMVGTLMRFSRGNR